MLILFSSLENQMKEKMQGNQGIKCYLSSREKVVIPYINDVVFCGKCKRHEQ